MCLVCSLCLIRFKYLLKHKHLLEKYIESFFKSCHDITFFLNAFTLVKDEDQSEYLEKPPTAKIPSEIGITPLAQLAGYRLVVLNNKPMVTSIPLMVHSEAL